MSVIAKGVRARPLIATAYLGRVIFPEGETMIDLKWYVIAAALVAFALLLNFDLTFGLIAGGVMLAIVLVRMGFAIWLAPERGEPDSERGALVERFRRLTRNRHAARIKELAAKRGSDAQSR